MTSAPGKARWRTRPLTAALLVALLVAAGACSGDDGDDLVEAADTSAGAAAPTSPSTTSTAPSSTAPTTAPTAPTTAPSTTTSSEPEPTTTEAAPDEQAPADEPSPASAPSPASGTAGGSFTFEVSTISPELAQRMTPTSWRDGCPVALADLRYLRISHWDFAGGVQLGELVVHADVVGDLEAVFGQLFDAGFPIGRMRLVDDYGGDDFASIEAGNTSAFNCRAATGSIELVAARLRPGHRRQPAGEPLRLGRRHRPSGLRALPRPHAPPGDGHRGRRAGGRLRRRGLGLGWPLERAGRLPALLGQRRLTGGRPAAGRGRARPGRHAVRRAGTLPAPPPGRPEGGTGRWNWSCWPGVTACSRRRAPTTRAPCGSPTSPRAGSTAARPTARSTP